ncbi:MAG: alanine--tRNA ligase [Candidatus Eisenbacteria bacterium]|nr:alanine--tRNA ligase [Candidatus Eisenbacteria bacterium]
MIRSADLRHQYLEFFAQRDHRVIPSSSIVPKDDPTLLFTSAGMVQFKQLYAATGRLEFTRATSVQKCFRVTDLELVGHTPRHCTFFEMLGNFSFGDYFKREAIAWAWEFCTDVLKMPSDRLWASVYLDDDEAANIWTSEIGLPADRIVRLGRKDNFWGPAGASGACGPCSEIYYDLGPAFGPDTARPGDEHDRYQEFWNLVFPQFFQDEQGNLGPLAKRGIDTGMGLERLTQILNGQASVFETDAFRPIIEAAADMASVDPDSEAARIPLRIIAEHARALTVATSEGIYPGNEGRGYVIRRLLRRAARRGQMIGLSEPFLHKLSGVVVDILGDHYTELRSTRERVALVLRAEEERFLATVAQGMHRFEEIAGRLGARGETALAGADAFLLYDTFGFPFDLTVEMAAERGLSVDHPAFESEMARQVKRSRAASKFETAAGESDQPWQWLAPADESSLHSEFVGYEGLLAPASLVAVREAGEAIEFLLDRTPFYAEGGGQVADTGLLESPTGQIRVDSVRKNDKGEFVHRGTIVRGEITPGPWSAEVPGTLRRATERNHTATHLLHAALRQVLGTHVAQAGSLVTPDRLRFDFAHFAAITAPQREEIERLVNEAILADLPVVTEWGSLDAARASGAMALFGEKYGERVRQVIVSDVSRELCGGTHVRRTGEIGAFRLIAEESVASGTRRIEAATGWKALRLLAEDEAVLDRMAERLKAGRGDVEEKLQHLLEENQRLRQELDGHKSRALAEKTFELTDQIVDLAGIRFLAAEVPADSMDSLRDAADTIKSTLRSGAAVLGARFDGKAMIIAVVTDDLAQSGRLKADQIVREVARLVGGSGGGKANFATAGAKQPDRLPEAIGKAAGIVEQLLS